MTVLAILMLVVSGISMTVNPANAQAATIECQSQTPYTLNPGDKCNLVGASKITSLYVNASILFAPDGTQDVKIQGQPAAVTSECNKTLTLSAAIPTATHNCVRAANTTGITVENVEVPFKDMPVRIRWGNNTL
ncbi:MAG: hypothetical protein JGK24_23310 [Microcoleus sp. PH2017_29_MFU_D_A]|uniref:hypothetical protein n=2 Tax=Microcoleus TaxID=44471 RepID=UPI001DA6E27D|nr:MULTISPECIES: hypothetical protein [unclassified Microcoleus]MCC3587076.1 hypothetical protein [Microcoleus sp. PH2017_30_WIL_O_A]MCC3606075.1 hypothetical protein [Microcoleus sp. PH2017_29_MFU_D_A]